MDAASTLRDARRVSGLSARSLAHRAGTPASTVTRIEAGTSDPTVAMLDRLLDAAGCRAVLIIEPKPRHWASQLRDLSDAWSPSPRGDRPDWTRLRAFLDGVALHPDEAAFAIRSRPPRSGSLVLDALLAGIADKVADDHGLRRPSWTAAATRRLSTRWHPPGTPAMQVRAEALAPPQMIEHGVAVSTNSLWRDRQAADA